MFAATAVVTGLVNVIFFRGIAVLGASGLLFMLILIASFTSTKGNKIPLTFILVALVYIGNELIGGLLLSDNVSQFSHIIGGVCGAVFGFLYRTSPKGRRK
jgi:membrane associated rhomboid family serine protease